MPRIADVLERESRTVDLEPGDFERLLDRRDRTERNRRIGAGALAIIVVLATVAVLARAMSSGHVPTNRPVAPAPLSGAIAYDLKGHIHVAALDGSNPVAIADVGAIGGECSGEAFMRFPSWSPNGRYLAFYRGCPDPARQEIVIADLQGHVLGSFRVADPHEIVWSPDSTRVAVWEETSFDEGGSGTFTIGIHGLDGTSETFATPLGWSPSNLTGSDPIWTPDGASLIVSELEVPLDGGSPREIPFHGAFKDRSGGWWTGALAYSPDGSQMAYGTPQGLMVARADGSAPREVSGDAAHTAVWSPNGGSIAVASTAGAEHTKAWRGNYELAPNRLRVVDVATGSTTLLSEGKPGTWFFVIGFSPEGDRVLFGEHRPVEGQPEGTYLDSLWSIGVDGSDPRQIVVGTYSGVVRPAGPEGGGQP